MPAQIPKVFKIGDKVRVPDEWNCAYSNGVIIDLDLFPPSTYRVEFPDRIVWIYGDYLQKISSNNHPLTKIFI